MNNSVKHEVALAFQSEGSERRQISDEIANSKDEVHSMMMCGSCDVSSAASTGVRLGPGTFARQSSGSKLGGKSGCREIEVKGWVTGRSQQELTG